MPTDSDPTDHPGSACLAERSGSHNTAVNIRKGYPMAAKKKAAKKAPAKRKAAKKKAAPKKAAAKKAPAKKKAAAKKK